MSDMQNMEVAFPGFLPENSEAQSGVEQAPHSEIVKPKRQIRILKLRDWFEDWKMGRLPTGKSNAEAESEPDVVQAPPKSTAPSPLTAAKAAFDAKKKELSDKYVSQRAQQEATALEIMEFCRRNGISEIETGSGGKIVVRPETTTKVLDRDLLSETMQKHFGTTRHHAKMVIEGARKPVVKPPMVQFYKRPKGAHKSQ